MAGGNTDNSNGHGEQDDLNESYPDPYIVSPEEKEDDGGHRQPYNPDETDDLQTGG